MPNRLRRPFIIFSIQHLFLESLRAFHELEHYHDRASIFGSFGVFQLPLVVSASFLVVSASFVGVGLLFGGFSLLSGGLSLLSSGGVGLLLMPFGPSGMENCGSSFPFSLHFLAAFVHPAQGTTAQGAPQRAPKEPCNRMLKRRWRQCHLVSLRKTLYPACGL